MRAAVFLDADHPLVVENVEPLPPGPRDVVVRIMASGVCHSDLAVARGRSFHCPPAILGHEVAGVVEDVGPAVRRLAAGDRVVAALIPTCGSCWFCDRGMTHLCESSYSFLSSPRARRSDGSDLIAFIGGFAQQLTLPEDNLVRVQTDLPDAELALIGCAVTTGIGAVVNTARVAAGSTVAVIGCGGVGHAVIQAARLVGADRIIAVDPLPAKRSRALEAGASDVIDPGVVDAALAVRELTGGRGADYAFEVVGRPEPARQAFDSVRRGGTVTLVGVPAAGSEFSLPGSLVTDGKRVLGCIYGESRIRSAFPQIVNLIERGRLNIGAMVTETIPLEKINEAFDAMTRGDGLRTVIV